MLRIILLFSSLVFTSFNWNTHETAPPLERYIDPIFESIEQRTTIYANKNNEVLRMDVYRPLSDTLSARPLLLYVHGGGFAGGSRDDKLTVSFAEQMTRRGFVVVSISYRLTMKNKSFSCDQARRNKIRTFQMAVEDIRSATNYLLDRKKELGIDPSRVCLAGSSAGAEAVLHAAYWQDRDLLDSAPHLQEGFQYAGVISMAGAIVDKELITSDNAIPMAFFHGTCDNLVPYGTAPHHYCEEGEPGYMTLHGSYALAEHLREMGKSYYLFSHCGGNHGWASYPMEGMVPEIATFLKEQIVEGQFQQLHYLYHDSSPCERVEGLPFCK
ncbi:MAG: alpha/beta hydrolase [Chitinophagales bacterium]|nr:alpha/beta hydrolase [Chitinophagales bacterium]